MKLLVSAGGTGGGIYPALAVVSAIRERDPAASLHFVGSVAGLEHELIAATDSHFESLHRVQAGPLHGVNPLRALVSLFKLMLGLGGALALMLRLRPHAAFLTGGWVTVPVGMAAWLCRVPIIIFVPDIEPGLTLKVLGRLARVVTATTEDTAAFFPKKRVVATGYPLRADLKAATPQAGRERFKLDPDLLTLLVFGGSRGARAINQALLSLAEGLIKAYPLQVIHVTGATTWAESQAIYAALPDDVRARYQLHEYLHDLGLAMAAADVVVARAGASTLGEFPYFQLPAILIPLEFAWRYQRVNAEWLASRGAALWLTDDDLPDGLGAKLEALFKADSQRAEMSAAAAALRITDGAERIAAVIWEEMRS